MNLFLSTVASLALLVGPADTLERTLDAHGGLVEPHTAEEYFSGSQWYDRTCLNEQWKIQGVQPTDDVRRCVLDPKLGSCEQPNADLPPSVWCTGVAAAPLESSTAWFTYNHQSCTCCARSDAKVGRTHVP